MALTPADPIPQTYLKMLFDGSFGHVADLAGPINDALALREDGTRLLAGVQIKGMTEGDLTAWWNITFTRPDGTNLPVLEPGRWVVVSSLGKIRVLTDDEYRAEFKPDPPA